MQADKQIYHLLLVVVLHVLFVESAQSFQSVVHYTFQISTACPRYIGMCGPCACVMLWNEVTIVGPTVFKVDDKHIWRFCASGCLQNRLIA